MVRGLPTAQVPDEWKTGPILTRAELAHALNWHWERGFDGIFAPSANSTPRTMRRPHLVLRPGAGKVRTRLAISRLRPGGAYAVTGGSPGSIVAGP